MPIEHFLRGPELKRDHDVVFISKTHFKVYHIYFILRHNVDNNIVKI